MGALMDYLTQWGRVEAVLFYHVEFETWLFAGLILLLYCKILENIDYALFIFLSSLLPSI